MLSLLWQLSRVLIVSILVVAFAAHPSLLAQTHVVSSVELQKEAVGATRARQDNLETVNAFLSSPKAKNVLRSAKMDPTQVKNAVSSLTDVELARLASSAEKAQNDFAAGTLSDRDLLMIILGIAALVLIIVAVR